MNYVLYIVSIHLHSIFCSAHQSEVRPVRDTQREESNVHVSMYVRMYAWMYVYTTYVFLYECMHVLMYMCKHACMYYVGKYIKLTTPAHTLVVPVPSLGKGGG